MGKSQKSKKTSKKSSKVAEVPESVCKIKVLAMQVGSIPLPAGVSKSMFTRQTKIEERINTFADALQKNITASAGRITKVAEKKARLEKRITDAQAAIAKLA